MNELEQRMEAAKARVALDNLDEDRCVVRLDDVPVFTGWSVWAQAAAGRLVVALASDVQDFTAVSAVIESLYEDGPDPHPKAAKRVVVDTEVHEITHVAWNSEFETFEFIACCPECGGSGKGDDQLNCEKCNGSGVIEVMGCGREP